jgi:hypothetical protein
VKRASPGAQPRCRTLASCGDSETCLKLTACGDADRVRHRSIHRDRPALPPRVADRSGAGIGRQSACSPLLPKPARGRVREGAKVLRSGSRAITRRWSGLAIRSSGVVNRLVASRSTPAFVDKMRSPCRGEVGHAQVVRPSDPAAPALRRHHVRCGGIELRWLASPACGNMEPPIHRARCAWDRPLGRGRVACVQRVCRSNSATVMDGISELLQ